MVYIISTTIIISFLIVEAHKAQLPWHFIKSHHDPFFVIQQPVRTANGAIERN